MMIEISVSWHTQVIASRRPWESHLQLCGSTAILCQPAVARKYLETTSVEPPSCIHLPVYKLWKLWNFGSKIMEILLATALQIEPWSIKHDLNIANCCSKHITIVIEHQPFLSDWLRSHQFDSTHPWQGLSAPLSGTVGHWQSNTNHFMITYHP